MLTVYKYVFNATDVVSLSLPAGAVIRHCGYQAYTRSWCAWVECEPTAPPTLRVIRMAGTGHPLNIAPHRLKYINTVLPDDGEIVFHFYEVLP